MSEGILFYRRKSQLICSKSEVEVRAKNILKSVLCLYPLPDLTQAFQKVFLRVWRESKNFILSFWCPIPFSLLSIFPSWKETKKEHNGHLGAIHAHTCAASRVVQFIHTPSYFYPGLSIRAAPISTSLSSFSLSKSPCRPSMACSNEFILLSYISYKWPT